MIKLAVKVLLFLCFNKISIQVFLGVPNGRAFRYIFLLKNKKDAATISNAKQKK